MWAALNDDEKAPYYAEYKSNKARYGFELEEYETNRKQSIVGQEESCSGISESLDQSFAVSTSSIASSVATMSTPKKPKRSRKRKADKKADGESLGVSQSKLQPPLPSDWTLEQTTDSVRIENSSIFEGTSSPHSFGGSFDATFSGKLNGSSGYPHIYSSTSAAYDDMANDVFSNGLHPRHHIDSPISHGFFESADLQQNMNC